MATIKIKVSDKILDKVVWLLRQFKPEGLEILEYDPNFESNKAYLDKELNRLETGEARTFTVEEADQILKETIREYEY